MSAGGQTRQGAPAGPAEAGDGEGPPVDEDTAVRGPAARSRPRGTPLGLALLLERSGARLVAPPQLLAPGVALLELAAAVPGPRPATAASCRGRGCALARLQLRVDPPALQAWVQARVVGASLPGWRVEHVTWDMLNGTGEDSVWTLGGRAGGGAAVWLRVELERRAGDGRLELRARRCWLLGPPDLDAARVWRALVARLARGPGIRGEGEVLAIDASRAALGASFAAVGWTLPGARGLGVAVEVRGEAVLIELRAGNGWSEGQVGWSEGQAEDGGRGGSEGQGVAAARRFDPLAEVRRWIRGGPGERARAEDALRGLAAAVPAVAATLLRARALALRFVDRERCVSALQEWLHVAPADAEARWLRVVQRAVRGEDDALIAALRGLAGPSLTAAARVQQRLALALVLQRRDAGGSEARALLEPMVAELPGCAPELQAAVWRALARARAADAEATGSTVLDAVGAALGEEGWRRREEAGELRSQVAAALVASGRGEADTGPLLRHLLGGEGPGRTDRSRRAEPAPRRGAASERGAERRAGPASERGGSRGRADPRTSARLVADYYAQEGRWSELVALLGRELVHLDGVPRIQALRRIARIHRHYLHDPASAEQALRVALAQPTEDEATVHDQQLLQAELVTCLEMQGRLAEAAAHLEAALAPELAAGAAMELAFGTGGEAGPERAAGTGEAGATRLALETGDGGVADAAGEGLAPERAALLVRLGRLARDQLDDEPRAGAAFAALLAAGQVPDDGLATLARVYRGSGRYVALAEVLRLRLRRSDPRREPGPTAELHRRLAELLDGPLKRGDAAAQHHLAAFLADAATHASCGARARALLAGLTASARQRAVEAALDALPAEPTREVRAWSLAAEAVASAPAAAQEAAALYRRALRAAGVRLSGGTGGEGLSGGTGGEGLSGETGEEGLSGETGGEELSGETGEEGLSGETGGEGLSGGTGDGAAGELARSSAVGAAASGLGRVLLRAGRGAAAARALAWAAGCVGREDGLAVEDALQAAQAWVALGALEPAEAVLQAVRAERPPDARVLLELSRVYDLRERIDAEDAVLAALLALPVAPALRAEVLLRRAQLRDYADDPHGAVGDEAFGLLQAGFAADPRHVDAREALRALAEARGAWSVVVQTIAAALRGLPARVEGAVLHLDLAELHLLHLGDPDSGRRSLGRALTLAPHDPLIRGRAVVMLEAAEAGAGEPAWLLALAEGAELGDAARAAVLLVLGALRLRAQALDGAAAAWQRVFTLAAPGEAALAEARQQLESLGHGGDLQAQRLGLQRLLAREEQPEERLPILARLRELGQALADEALIEASCRESLALARGAPAADELREATLAALRAILARRGALDEIATLYAEVDADTRDAARGAACLVEAARFAEQVAHAGSLAVDLALRAWRRAPGAAPVADLLVELAEHAAHGPGLFAALEAVDLAAAPGAALRLAEAALRLGREEAGRRWLEAVARGADAASRRAALARLDALLAANGPPSARLPVLRALVAELRAAVGAVFGDRSVAGDVPEDRSVAGAGDVPEDRSVAGDVPGDRSVAGDVPGDRSVAVAGDVPEDRSFAGDVPGDRSVAGDVPGDRSVVGELAARTLELARLELALGELDAALATCLSAVDGADAERLELAVGLLAQRERWEELVAVCERRAALAASAGDGAGEAAWLTRAAQLGIDHATQPRRAMHEARRLLLRARQADRQGEAARASLVPLSFAEHRWDEVLEVAAELRAIAGEDYDVLIVAALTEALVHGRTALARAIGARHEASTLRRMLGPALARVLTEVARAGALAQLDAVLAAAAALYGSSARLRVELQTWSAGRSLQPGVTLGLARLHESIGHAATARALLQLAVFMAPQGPIAAWVAALPPLPMTSEPAGHDQEPTLESREALRAVLRLMAGETAGIRALGEPPASPRTEQEARALQLAEAEVGPLRAALGLELPVLLGRGGPDGGVSVRNDRPPAIVVGAVLAELPAAERRFRLALAAAMIANGLAIVTDPQGASLPELLAALHHLADETCPLRLVGAQTIVRACAARGFTRQRLPVGLREALAREISRWQHGRASVARLAHLLRRDSLRVATRLSGALDGALRTIGRDARVLPPGPLDEHGAMQVLASEDAQWLLRSSGVFA